MDLALANRTVLVAGSSRGIGYAIAGAFLEEGCRVCLSGRSATKLERARRTLVRSFPGRVEAFCGDLSQTPVIEKCLEMLASKWRRVDAVVANYGNSDTPAVAGADVSDDDWARLLDHNLSGPFRLGREAARLMADQGGGALVFIGSIAGQEYLGAPLNYAVPKHALLSLVKSFAKHYARWKIRTNLVSPGNVLFHGGRWEERLKRDPFRTRRMLAEKVPLARFAKPREIADAVVFLASPRAAFITGACLVVDGGQTSFF